MLKISKQILSFLEKRLVFFAGGPEEIHIPEDTIIGRRPEKGPQGPMQMPEEKVEAGKEPSKEAKATVEARKEEMKKIAEDFTKGTTDLLRPITEEGRKEIRDRVQAKIDELKNISGRERDVTLLENYLKRADESEKMKDTPDALESPDSTHRALLRVMSGIEKREKATKPVTNDEFADINQQLATSDAQYKEDIKKLEEEKT